MVVLAARKQAPLEQTAAEIRAQGGKVNAFIAYTSYRQVDIRYGVNIRQAQSVREMVQSVIETHGKLTHVVNNAGGQFLSPAESISDKGWQAVIDTNLTGTWNVCRAAFDAYMRDHGGCIVNVTMAMQNGYDRCARARCDEKISAHVPLGSIACGSGKYDQDARD
jgi:NAD(P)-dependent dehydrogenase (short-subunit alcohol dehydrogenase family)